ncbi:YaaA family protein [Georgenia faecalis]|uniref:YaaA family protein n=1 Tax=Georgenia faecalis TaxID=2483799 RepID=A0ABV9D985_9MICO|nr:peroxide stress protein YaaA [Georgenia faecalis]
MLILLPPSEGKTAPADDDGTRLHLPSLTFPELTSARTRVLTALRRASARGDAVEVLGVGASLAGEVARNTRLAEEPVAPAARVYTGVLYAAAGLADLDDAARERAARSVLTVSGLWGALSPAAAIPAYRLSMGTDLPGVGPLPAFWRGELAGALDPRASGDVVVDARSSTYRAAYRPPSDADWVEVRVVRETAGRRTVVSHNAKHTRGVLTRHLLTRPAPEPADAAGVLAAAGELVGTELRDAELSAPTRARIPATLTLVV